MKSTTRFIFLFLGYLAVAGGMYYEFGNLNDAVESVRQENQINQGLAVYMPGASCVIKATPDIDIQKFKDLAAACSIKHLEYLESQKDTKNK
tara:strand:+ start:316 stop:591 length:276 start_codon:yes stop_codon:yes gene_type:complete